MFVRVGNANVIQIPSNAHKTKLTVEQELLRRQEVAMAYAEQGCSSKAVNRLDSEGLAPDTVEVANKMRSKFVPAPASQALSRRPTAPAANDLSTQLIASSIRSFHWGAGAGPSGCRPDLLRQIIGAKTDKEGLSIITLFSSAQGTQTISSRS